MKFGEIKAGDVIKYNFSYPQDESIKTPFIVGTAFAEVMEVTPKYCILEYTDFAGKNVKVPYDAIIKAYCDISQYMKLDEL